MLVVVWPVAWALLIPIIALEALVALPILRVGYKTALKAVAKANVASTLVGVPVTWLILVVFQLCLGGGSAWGDDTKSEKILAVTLQAPWLIPYEHDFGWMIPSAASVLCIPFFFMSVWVENRVASRYFCGDERPMVLRWAWLGNAASYCLILIWLAFEIWHGFHSGGVS